MNLALLAKRASDFAIHNSPSILTTVGVVGSITTAYLAGKASFEAANIIALKEADDEQRGEEYLEDPKEVLKHRVELVWRLYIPAVGTGVATIACIIGANRVGARRAAGLAAAYSITERTLDEYKAKVVEKLGEKKEDAVQTEVLQERVQRTEPDDPDMYELDKGVMCFDAFSARYFRSTVEEIRAAINTINNRLNHDGYACLGDLYRLLDIPPTAYSDLIGWNSDRLIEENIHSVLDKRDNPIVVMDFRNQPGPDYSRFH